jgi:TPP-dependent pyruvate/acetoin dehydrogenase alpha subunit
MVTNEVDPLERFEKTLEERGITTRAQMDKLRADYTQELLDASRQIRFEPQPEPSQIHEWVFADKNYVGGEE